MKFAYMRLPYGIKDVPATYQRAIDNMLTTVKWQFAIICLAEITVFSSSFKDHKSHLRTVLELTESSGVTFSVSMC